MGDERIERAVREAMGSSGSSDVANIIEVFLAALVRCDICGRSTELPERCKHGQPHMHSEGDWACAGPIAEACLSHRPHVVLAERDGKVVVLESETYQAGEQFDVIQMKAVVPFIVARLDDA